MKPRWAEWIHHGESMCTGEIRDGEGVNGWQGCFAMGNPDFRDRIDGVRISLCVYTDQIRSVFVTDDEARDLIDSTGEELLGKLALIQMTHKET